MFFFGSYGSLCNNELCFIFSVLIIILHFVSLVAATIMDFDSVLLEIGEFGRYQQTNYMLLCLPVLFGAANSLSYVFTAGIPNYR